MQAKSSPKSVVASTTGRQAVEELQVYRRAMRAAQRRWTKEITVHESHVRKLMMVEEHCRTQLKKRVMKGTLQHLRYLVNTDLMVAAQVATPPSVETFAAYAIPARQITGFSVYVMGILSTDPGRMDLPLLTLMADLLSSWTVVSPSRKEAYEELAVLFGSHVRSSRQSTSAGRVRVARASPSAPPVKEGKQGAPRVSRGAYTAALPTGKRSNLVVTGTNKLQKRVAPALQRVRRSAHQTTRRSPPSPSTSCASASPHSAQAISPIPSAASDAAPAVKTPMMQTESHSRRPRDSQASATDGLASAVAVSAAETKAFRRFAAVTLRQMRQALSSVVLDTPPSSAVGGAGKSRQRGGSATSMTMAEWIPIAEEEWKTLTQRQRRLYYSEKGVTRAGG